MKSISLSKHIILFLLSLSSIACAEKDDLKYVPYNPKTYDVVGRYVEQPNGTVMYSLPGVSIYTSFEGTSLDIVVKDFEGNNYLAVIIDKEEPRLLSLNANDTIYSISKTLINTIHQLQIVKRTESFVGTLEFKGIRVDTKSEVRKYENLAKNKLLVIGNSITCGYGNDTSIYQNPSTGFTPRREDNYHSYGSIAARGLDALYMSYAYSGRGLHKNYNGDTIGAIPTIFDQVIPDNPKYLWDHKKYQPNWIVVNLGTNDFSTETQGMGKIDSTSFVSNYSIFVENIKKEYPNSTIILSVGSMMSDYYPQGAMQWTRIQNYVKSVVEIEKQKGNSKIYFLAFQPQQAPYGEDWHPNIATHEKMANLLVDFINKLNTK